MVLDDPNFFLVTSVSIQVITLNVFSIRYFRSISTGTRKILFLSFHIVNGQKDVLSLTLPSLHLLQGIRWPRHFSCNHSQLFLIICFTFITLICWVKLVLYRIIHSLRLLLSLQRNEMRL